ncbi:MAG TPA: ATP-binding protein, partial [Longimicrobiaceae bacterium]|nr:ATP-binding protein [Longimicrobiaceae bacterium]
WADVVITALRDRAGKLVGFGKVTRDLTERTRADAERQALEREREARREAEELNEEVRNQAAHLEEQAVELEALNEEMRLANEELDERTREAEAANRAKSDFLANMSHELRTPLNAILGYVELLTMGIPDPATEAQKEQMERIRGSGEHLATLIDDILDLARIEAGRVAVEHAHASLPGVVDTAISLLTPEVEAHGLTLARHCDDGAGIEFIGDALRVRQIVANLLSNAVKFTHQGGRITVSCDTARGPGPSAHLRRPGPWVRVRVEDTGIGIAPEQRETIFQPFVQVETGRTRTHGGTGLGLSISRDLARLMRGDITVESEPDRGSCFTLWLPGVGPGAAGE